VSFSHSDLYTSSQSHPALGLGHHGRVVIHADDQAICTDNVGHPGKVSAGAASDVEHPQTGPTFQPAEQRRRRRARDRCEHACRHRRAAPAATRSDRSPRLERAIGVIYRPQTERQSHYFRSRVSDQFDALIHIDETRAVEPLERTAGWERGEVPETYPFAV
jgi:hypothetical protein